MDDRIGRENNPSPTIDNISSGDVVCCTNNSMSYKQLAGNQNRIKKFFLSICITSYNRVAELQRCLESIDTIDEDSVEIVISEDCSLKKKAIEEIATQFSSSSNYSVSFNTNQRNLGYDRNLERLIELASGKYVLFMSDDDMFCPGALDELLAALRLADTAVAFSPFIVKNTGRTCRQFNKTVQLLGGLSSVKKYLYCSILFSGLVFKRELVANCSARRFVNSNYFQVYLFISILNKFDGYYFHTPLVHCMNDGENGFGTNDSSGKNSLLADRTSVYSDLEFHKGLVAVIKMFDTENRTDLADSFAWEYSLRTYRGLSEARKLGREVFYSYWQKLNALGIKLSWPPTVYYWSLKMFGSTLCDAMYGIPKEVLLKYKQKH